MSAPTKKRVLMLLENNPYPQDDRMRREAISLTASGYDVTLICPRSVGQRTRELIDGVNVYRYPAPPSAKGFFGYVIEYAYSMIASFGISLFVLVRRGFDVVHAANPPDTFAFIALFYKLLGKRFVYDHHDLAPEMYLARFNGKGNRFVYHALIGLEKFACRVADRVIATNASYKAVEMTRAGVPQDRITIVRNGPDLNRLKNTSPKSRDALSEKFILAYVGVMGFQDGLDYLLRALKHLRDTLGRKDFTCLFIGAGDAFPSLKALSEQLDLTDYVRFTGWIEHNDVAQYLGKADICVAPEPSNDYTDRSTTIKLMEYMALEKPIVAFDLPEHRFTADRAALFVTPNDELAFAKALIELMEDPVRRQAMGVFGRQRIDAELAWSHSVPHLLEVYRDLCADEPCRITVRRRGNVAALRRWLERRSPGYVAIRLISLLKRYGITATKAKRRALECVGFFSARNCCPTLPVPGRVVERNATFCREVQAKGAELAVHGYDHVDFLNLSDAEANRQFVEATGAFDRAGIQFDGFRCPYLSYSDRLIRLLPKGRFGYSSNRAVAWDVIPAELKTAATSLFENLQGFYRAESSELVGSTPHLVGDLVEIPISLPDDLQLHDGLKLRGEKLAQPWIEILHRTHRSSELFALMFHPELFSNCKFAFEKLLIEASELRPPVWMTQLREISGWWREKSTFGVETAQAASGLRIQFVCSDRATILLRNLVVTGASTNSWAEGYHCLESRVLNDIVGARPFIGLSSTVPPHVPSFLKEQGYIVDQTPSASRCGIYLDASIVERLSSQVALILHIESLPAPLVKFSRWPEQKKSALCITGDLDALSLMDYTARLLD